MANKRLPRRTRSLCTAAVLAVMVVFSAPKGFGDPLAQVPLYLAQSVDPILMLTMSRDHQLYFKAYDDYADITGDGTPDTTYTHDFDYYGYFDHHMCYSYSTANQRFEPAAKTTDKYCDGSHWSGNFLNWASMTRMDEVRKILYGGYRVTDTSSDTTLERSYLPNDAHSFAKYYAGADISQLTPISSTLAASPTYHTAQVQSVPNASVPSGALSFSIGTVTGAEVPRSGDQVKIANTNNSSQYMLGTVTGYTSGTLSVYVTSSVPTSGFSGVSSWAISNPSRVGITLCNTTVNNSGAYSQNVSDPPLIRVAQGNYALWSANERWQCRWFEEKGNTGQIQFPPSSGISPSNGNDISRTGLGANNTNPVKADVGLVSGTAGPDFVARVQVCKTGLVGDYEKCKQYPSVGSARKPIGVLQNYGDDGSMWVGLMTGSYGKNKSGGVLRKKAMPFNNITDLTDGTTGTSEVKATTNGTFTGSAGIVTTLNKLRVYGYSHSDGVYTTGDSCDWGLNSFSNGNCSNWGNPQAEIFLESLRYFAGKDANSAFSTDDSTRITGLTTATWADPLSDENWCAKLNVLNFNASVTSYDGDDLAKVTDINTTDSAADLTDAVGSGEGIDGHSYFVGENGTNNNKLCTAKTVDGLGSVRGACPEAPRLSGTYDIAGLAHQAHTHSIRSDLRDSQNRVTDELVTTYGVALAPAIPKVTIPVPGSASGQAVTILPACRDYNGSVSSGNLIGNCALVDFKIVQPYTVTGGVGTGSFYVNWEDSEQGGDFDQDMSGVVGYSITSSQITVTTRTYIKSTPYLMGFGYVISGTTKDGFHAHSGINGFSYPGGDPTGVTACSTCNVTDSATSVTYALGAGDTTLLQPALWYAAKWGGFHDINDDGVPGSGEWDMVTAGQPDNYSAVTDPGKLEAALDKVFKEVHEEVSSSSSVVANSVALQTDARLYQARFNSGDWSGQLWSYVLNSDGSVGNVGWDASCVLSGTSPCQIRDTTHGNITYTVDANSQPARQIITYKPNGAGETPAGPVGVPFTWAGLGTSSGTPPLTAQQQALDVVPYGVGNDTLGEDRLNYLRGDRSQEQQETGGIFRTRGDLLGDIVDSSPAYVGAPSFNYPDVWSDGGPETAYSAFRSSYSDRTPVVYAGANDGMLHGFDASIDTTINPPTGGPTSSTGTEVVAYVPNAVFSNLSKLTSPNYVHQYYVDGPPTTGDAFFGDEWHTVLVAGLRGGGSAIYALDITDPSQFAESNAANIVLWEFSNLDTTGNGASDLGHDANLGYTFSQPAILRMSNKKWAAVFGNGYHSADLTGDGKAYLYVVDLQTGKRIRRFGPLGTLTSNGLSTPAPVDIDGDSIVDYIYAGDLQGNLWKFDVRATKPSDWTVAFSGTPLYTARDADTERQPITSRPQVGASPTGTGFLIYFGTGKYFESRDSDVVGATTQTFYAIWDKNDGSSNGFTRSDLQPQTVVTTASKNGFNLRVTSDNQFVWRTDGDTAKKMGWYIDLPSTGERQVSDSLLRGGMIIFTTLIPSKQPCDSGGSSWLMELDAFNGARPSTSPFDLNDDGNFDLADTVNWTTTDENGETTTKAVSTSGVAPTNPGIFWTPLIVSQTQGTQQFKYMSESTSAVWNVTENPGSAGRQTWRQIQ